MFVMDEADKLLSPEFVPLIDRLLSFTPPTRQVLCFSATFPKTVVAFRDQWCPGAHEINLMEELTLKGVTQFYAFVDERQKVHCICEGSLVSLADGSSLPIEQVHKGAQVLSYHAALAPGETEGLAVRQVDAVLDQGRRDCVELLFSDKRTLVCTPDHRIRTADGRWVLAGELEVGTDEVAVSGQRPSAAAEKVEKVAYDVHRDARLLPLSRVRLVGRRDVGVKHVYDLSVPSAQGEDTRSFVANGVVVHNVSSRIRNPANRLLFFPPSDRCPLRCSALDRSACRPCSRSSTSTSASSSATPSRASSCWPRRSQNWDRRVGLKGTTAPLD